MPQRFCVQIERDAEGDLVASVIDLPGCHAQARSMGELTNRLHEAIADCTGMSVQDVRITKQTEKFVSGKSILRSFNDLGQLTAEMHVHGMIAISLKRDYRPNGEIEEIYCVNKRLVSRQRYLKEREKYPDMPHPDDNSEDISGELVAGTARERRQQRVAAKTHVPDAEQARQGDVFCRDVMEAGECQDAQEWIKSGSNTLGELTPAQSRKLVAKLVSLGSSKIHACRIDQEGDWANTGHLVVELPAEASVRKAILRQIAKLAAKQGYAGPVDDGQRLAYLKLD